jgi:hypothetical protein
MAMPELHTARFVSEERRQGGYVAFTLNLPVSTKHTTNTVVADFSS